MAWAEKIEKPETNLLETHAFAVDEKNVTQASAIQFVDASRCSNTTVILNGRGCRDLPSKRYSKGVELAHLSNRDW